MTYEEAIKIIKIAKAEVEWNYPLDYHIALNMAIEALKKQISKPPNIIDWSGLYDDGFVEFKCPGCGDTIEYLDDHCECCGKSIDWETDKKGRQKMTNNFLNKKVIVRGDRSGVFFGTLVEREGKEVKLEKCRRIWYWDGAASISQLAKEGTKKPKNCKFTITVDSIVILDAIEIILCTDEAIKSIEGVDEWKM